MLKQWIKEYGLRYEGVLVTGYWSRRCDEYWSNAIENDAYDRELWWSTKLKTHVYQKWSYINRTNELYYQGKNGCYERLDIDLDLFDVEFTEDDNND